MSATVVAGATRTRAPATRYSVLGDKQMRIGCLVTGMLVALSGCASSNPTAPPEPFNLEGAWLYLGPSDIPHTLKIDHSSMVYADVDGHWSSNWTIQAYDNEAHHFQIVFGSGSGAYLPVGASMSGAYDVSGTFLTVQLAKDLTSYPPLVGAGTCTNAADGTPVPDCRLYVKQN